jgi:hypothetical protein
MKPKKYRAYWVHEGHACSVDRTRITRYVRAPDRAIRSVFLWLDVSKPTPVAPTLIVPASWAFGDCGGLPDAWVDEDGNLRGSHAQIIFEA